MAVLGLFCLQFLEWMLMHSLTLLLSQNQDTASAFSSNHDCFQTMSFLKWNIFTENVLLNASSETCTTFYAVVLHPWWSNDFWPLLHGHGDSGNSGTVCSLLKLSWSSLSLKIPDPQFCDAQNHWLWPSLYFSNLVSFFLTCSTCGIGSIQVLNPHIYVPVNLN